MAPRLCHDLPHRHVASRVHALPRPPAVLDARLHLVAPKPRRASQFLGPAGLYGPLSSVGADGLQPDTAWNRA